jgi:hypothetical protein
MRPDKRTAYCECGYDKTLSGLSEEEKQIARFYLLGQVGGDVKSRFIVGQPDIQTLLKVSNAIGNAGKRCR